MQQVIIGLDTSEMLNEMELTGPAEIDFGIEEIEDEDSDLDYEDDENDDDDDDEDEDDEQVSGLLCSCTWPDLFFCGLCSHVILSISF